MIFVYPEGDGERCKQVFPVLSSDQVQAPCSVLFSSTSSQTVEGISSWARNEGKAAGRKRDRVDSFGLPAQGQEMLRRKTKKDREEQRSTRD